MWSPDSSHVLLSHLNYVAGKVHGEQKKWYPTGELFKKLHLNMGKEEGLQQAFRKNGVLFANYEAKKGRVFGLKKAVLCFGLEDEKIQYEDE
jgi:antitoxin component YwqK of YwqJK toxin-antitoxin module